MKKYIFLSILSILSFKSGFTQCTPLPSTGNAGFMPSPDSFPCIERGEYFAQTLYFENFTLINGVSVEWLLFDFIDHLPVNIGYVLPSDTLMGGETGCIDFFGLSNDSILRYNMDFWVWFKVNVLPNPIHGKLDLILDNFGGPPMNYYIEIAIPGSACASYGGAFVNYISGKAYYDANSNGIMDTPDAPMSNIRIELNSGGASAFTRQDGSYYFFTDTGNFQVIAIPPTYFTLSSLPAVYNVTVTGSGSPHLGNNFGLTATTIIEKLDVWITAGPARPGFATIHWIHYQNNGTIPLNGTITYNIDPVLTFTSSTVVTSSLNNNVAVWDFTNLFPGEQRSIQVKLQIPPDVNLIGDTLSSNVSIMPSSGNHSGSGKDAVIQAVTGSYDPNDKLVTPDDSVNGVRPEIPLTYTVRFQNTGTDTAFTVVIRDTLDNNFDLTSFKTIGSSHDARFQLEGRYATWTLNNILLPDSGINEPGSHGFVKYTIQFKNNVNDKTIVQNRASIYFDFNPAIVTNTVKTRVEFDTGIRDEQQLRSFAYPNPANSSVVIQLSRFVTDADLLIKNVSGKMVKEYKGITGEIIILNLNDLDNGIYLYQFTSSSQPSAQGKLVIVK